MQSPSQCVRIRTYQLLLYSIATFSPCFKGLHNSKLWFRLPTFHCNQPRQGHFFNSLSFLKLFMSHSIKRGAFLCCCNWENKQKHERAVRENVCECLCRDRWKAGNGALGWFISSHDIFLSRWPIRCDGASQFLCSMEAPSLNFPQPIIIQTLCL